jgi:hypothetical protein
MHIYKLLRIGSNHKTHCEDFLLETKANAGFRLFGVFDGCSSGKDSFFASALIAKIIQHAFNSMTISPEKEKTALLNSLIWESCLKLKQISELIGLQTDELLSTIGLLLLDKKTESFQIIFIGDGLVSHDGKTEIIDQNNAPDYLAYYLHKIKNRTQAAEWLKSHARQFSGNGFKNLSISTDGILSFSGENTGQSIPDAINYLLNDNFLSENPSLLSRKANILKKKYALTNADDLGIIRLHNI